MADPITPEKLLKDNPHLSPDDLARAREFRARLKANGMKGAKFGLAIGERTIRIGKVITQKPAKR